MVQLTEELLRRKSEHNEGSLADLEEISLHQLNIEGINRILGKLCPMLEIIYLQNNLIPRIENLRRLKSLKYLNLAVNNIQKIENLDRNETLTKLDLTVNFIDFDGLLTIERLQRNFMLKELYLVGNPCTQWEDYRSFVIATLPSLQKLDGQEVTASERIIASQNFDKMKQDLISRAKLRAAERGVEWEEEGGGGGGEGEEEEEGEEFDPDKTEKWTPYTRTKDYQREQAREKKEEEEKEAEKRRKDPLYAEKMKIKEMREEEEKKGIMKQRNEGKWDFKFEEDDSNIILSIFFPRFLDTSLIDIDVQPLWVICETKGKKIQLQIPAEVRPDSVSAARSMATGALVLTMPKVTPTIKPKKEETDGNNNNNNKSKGIAAAASSGPKVTEISQAVDFRHLSGFADKFDDMDISESKPKHSIYSTPASEDFVDDPDVPPLE